MIPGNVIQRVFRLRYRGQTGTCFTIDVNGTQYFVTAKHVVQVVEGDNIVHELGALEQLELLRSGEWNTVSVLSASHSNNSDVSIFRIQQSLPASPMTASMGGIVYSQDVYFLGFPYGLSSVVGEVNRNFPLPFVRKGILASVPNMDRGGMFFIDGHNNPGFSGGPIVFKDQADQRFKVAGVIHGYNPEFKIVDGVLTPIENTNSNIIIGYSINNALDLIEESSDEFNGSSSVG